ncbi:site-specific integrase [Parablautia intestinalis]|uniref:Site-specific integrase n=1 Tax=Parablautia intestinalis TaxID=2320100 RepID=A0A3A9A5P9_9FIRM|nr:site-specific integrase [Parablautia intestinalis]RKI86972.1 site-specific integrase [Parablautia intestinalis]
MKENRKTNNLKLSLLQDLINFGILDIDSVLDTLMSKKIDTILKIHPYAITPPATQNGRCQTCYKDEKGKRKNIKAQSKEELLDKLIPIYFANTYIDKLTFYGLYEEWLAYKATVTNSSNTIKRHRQHYRKYFEPSVLHDMKIKKIDELILEQECNRIVREFNLPRKEWCNVKTILNGMYTYAVRKKYIAENPMDKIQIYVKYRQVVKKTGKTETYNTEELEKFAERQGVRTKSTHKMRKTYASNLNANGVPLDCIREMLGHSNLSTTLEYIYNPLTKKETYDLITKAL